MCLFKKMLEVNKGIKKSNKEMLILQTFNNVNYINE